jgi:uncharacterized membrane protein YccC
VSLALAYWIVLLILVVFGVTSPAPQPKTWRDYGGLGVLLVLFILIGWQVFGQPLHK